MYFVLRKFLNALGSVVGASIVVFVLLRIAPGDPVRLVVGPFASPDATEAMREQMGLNEPVLVQYFLYIADFIRGDWGYSFTLNGSVVELFVERLPATIELGLYAFVLAVAGALVLAVISVYRRRRSADVAVEGFAMLGLAIPQFWLGLVLLYALSLRFGVFPGPGERLSPGATAPPHVTGLYTLDALLTGQWQTACDAAWHLFLPAFALGLAPLGYLIRLLRANLIDVSGEPFLFVAESNGLTRMRVFIRHALPNAITPTVVASGLIFGQLLAGTIFIESVFQWPGIGQMVASGIQNQDYSSVQAYIMVSALIFVLGNLVADVFAGWVDPRGRSEANSA